MVYGKQVMSWYCVSEWHCRLEDNQESQNDSCSEQPVRLQNKDNMRRVQDVLHCYHCMIVDTIA